MYLIARAQIESLMQLLSFDMLLNVWIEYKTLVILRKVIATAEPKYLFSKLKFSASNRTNNLICQIVTHSYAEIHFFYLCCHAIQRKITHTSSKQLLI